jgi:hypothetical protein
VCVLFHMIIVSLTQAYMQLKKHESDNMSRRLVAFHEVLWTCTLANPYQFSFLNILT